MAFILIPIIFIDDLMSIFLTLLLLNLQFFIYAYLTDLLSFMCMPLLFPLSIYLFLLLSIMNKYYVLLSALEHNYDSLNSYQTKQLLHMPAF